MDDFLTDKPPLVLHEFLRQRIGIYWSEDFRGIGRVDHGTLIGVVGFEGFTGTACRIHFAGDRPGWLTRRFIETALRYPFVTLGLQLILATVPSGNDRSLRIVRKLGFEDVVCIEGAHPDGALHVLKMTRETWKRSKYGQEST